MRYLLRFTGLTTLALLSLPAALGQAVYTITDIGLFSDAPAPGNLSNATALNNSGVAAGYAVVSGSSHAITFENGTLTDLGTFGGPRSFAQGINDAGAVVGYASVSNFVDHAFVYSGGVKTDLGTLPGGGMSSWASAINTSGQIVGNAYLADNYTRRAFLYSGGAMTTIATLGGSGNTAVAINDSGQIAGTSYTTGDTVERAYRYSGGTLINLGLGGTYSFGHGINNAGHVVGQSNITGNTHQHAFHFNGEQILDLGVLEGTQSTAYDINNLGQIVGSATTAGNATFHAVMFSGGSVIDLNTLINPASGWVLNEALAINDAGQIAGYGTYDGRQHGFILTLAAIPEPSTYAAIAGLGALGLAVLKRRRREVRGGQVVHCFLNFQRPTLNAQRSGRGKPLDVES